MFSTVVALMIISDTLTVSPMGFTLHGIKPKDAGSLANKFDSAGRTAYNPMISAVYRTDHWQFGANVMKDCYDKPAGYLLAGPYLQLTPYFTWGAMIGGYARGTADSTAYSQTRLPLSKKTKNVEIAPMVVVTGSAEVPITKNLGFEANLATNAVLNHLQLGFKWHFGGRK